MVGMNMTHLDALELRLSHEKARAFQETNSKALRMREVWIAGIKKEIADEKAFLGIKDEPEIEMTDAELLSALSA